MNLGQRVKIDSKMVEGVHSCIYCGNKMDIKSYNSGHDTCGKCRYRNGYADSGKYQDYGMNNIDMILIDKIGRG